MRKKQFVSKMEAIKIKERMWRQVHITHADKNNNKMK